MNALTPLLWLAAFALAFVVLAYRRAPLWLHGTALAGGLAVAALQYDWPLPVQVALALLLGVPALLLNIAPLRRARVSKPLLAICRRILPPMSETERIALEAGTVWWDGELFTGAPKWDKLCATKPPQLSAEEQAFLDGPCEELCRMLDDWDITHVRSDLPPAVWDFLKAKGFFAMIIPKKYGGSNSPPTRIPACS